MCFQFLRTAQVPRRAAKDDGSKVPQKLLACVLLVHFLYAFSQSVFDAFFAAFRIQNHAQNASKAMKNSRRPSILRNCLRDIVISDLF